MINKILRDLINKEKVAVFVDNVLVRTETEEEYNEIVKEILRRLEENDLYIKPKKYVWKIRKIEFLGVVIGPNRIEMKKEKVDGVLSWPEPRNIEDIRKFLGLTNYYKRFCVSSQANEYVNKKGCGGKSSNEHLMSSKGFSQ